MPQTPLTVYTIGHSNYSLETLRGLLAPHHITAVVDVRSSPYAKFATHFNRESLQQYLEGLGLRYVYLGKELGGHPESPAYYDAEGYVRYDLLAASERFAGGIARVLRAAGTLTLVLLCSEEDPAGCHRRLLLGRVLAEQGVRVLHLRADGRVQAEEDLAAAERLARTAGQQSLFELPEEEPQWRSIQSATPRRAPPSSSTP